MLITTTDTLASFCEHMATQPYIAVDTEFLRERTFWPQLCLVQVGNGEYSVAIDPLAEGISLEPLRELLLNQNIVKIFHAARQDLEIFHHMWGVVPAPIFDTQVAATVLGYGESVGYEALIQGVLKQAVNKASRTTDWSRRPLTEAQLAYAIDDVRHLYPAAEILMQKLDETDRGDWVVDEMRALTDSALYAQLPEDGWLRMKYRNVKPKAVGIIRELANWREAEAQARDIPRGHVLKDDVLYDIALQVPKTLEELSHVRAITKRYAGGEGGEMILELVAKGIANPSKAPNEREKDKKTLNTAALELLKVLLKLKAEAHNVSPRLLAESDELEALASGEREGLNCLTDWRLDMFGSDALALLDGNLTIGLKGKNIALYKKS